MEQLETSEKIEFFFFPSRFFIARKRLLFLNPLGTSIMLLEVSSGFHILLTPNTQIMLRLHVLYLNMHGIFVAFPYQCNDFHIKDSF